MMYNIWGEKLRQEEEFCVCCGSRWSKKTSVTKNNPGIRVALSKVDKEGEQTSMLPNKRFIILKTKHVDTRNGPITIGTKHYV